MVNFTLGKKKIQNFPNSLAWRIRVLCSYLTSKKSPIPIFKLFLEFENCWTRFSLIKIKKSSIPVIFQKQNLKEQTIFMKEQTIT